MSNDETYSILLGLGMLWLGCFGLLFPLRPSSPIGRGNGFKTRPVRVQISPGAICYPPLLPAFALLDGNFIYGSSRDCVVSVLVADTCLGKTGSFT